MKKLEAILAAAFAALCMTIPALADIAVEPEPTTGSNAPLVAALVIVAAVAVILVSACVARRMRR